VHYDYIKILLKFKDLNVKNIKFSRINFSLQQKKTLRRESLVLIGAGGTKAGVMWLFTTFTSPVWRMKWG